MEPLLARLLIACLAVWFTDKVLEVFRVGEPARWVVQIIAVILGLLYIFLGWYLPLIK